MPLAVKAPDNRYFWTGWFTGQTFALLATLYILLSLADLIATARLIPFGVREGNALATLILRRYDMAGFILYKIALVIFVLGICRLIHLRDARLARIVLWLAVIAMGYVAILHITILSAILYLSGVG